MKKLKCAFLYLSNKEVKLLCFQSLRHREAFNNVFSSWDKSKKEKRIKFPQKSRNKTHFNANKKKLLTR